MSNKTSRDELPEVILVPGGPGLPAGFYRELTERITGFARVVTYEQRGSEPPDSDNYPRSVAAYAEELREVVERQTDIAAPTVLLGHSFGVAVVIESLLSGADAQGAILLNGFDSAQMLSRGLKARRQALPEPFHAAYERMEEKELETLMPLLGEYFYPTHFCRLKSWPASFLDAMGKLNMKLAEHFLGTDLFEPDGEIAGWDRSGDLAEITQPTLVVSGAHDYYLETDLQRMADSLGNGELWISERASHTPWVEDPEQLQQVLKGFLRRFH